VLRKAYFTTWLHLTFYPEWTGGPRRDGRLR
jgi:hypothetical protein